MRPFLHILRPAVLAVLALATCFAAAQTSQPTLWATRPDVNGFEKMVTDRLAAADSAIAQITSMKGPRTIENTLVPYDHALERINSALYLSNLIEQVHPEAAFRDRATEMVRKASAAQTALSLNHDVYQALASVDVSKADRSTRYYLGRQLLEFRLAGVDKDAATRDKLKQLNDQLTQELVAFDRNISDDQNKVEVTDPKQLDGLPPDYIDRHKPGPDGKIYITTSYPDIFPALTFSKSDDLRRRLFLAFDTRAYPKNQEVLANMMKARYQMATTLGYSAWADYSSADKMIRRGADIAGFIQKVDAAARPFAEREYAMLMAEERKEQPNATAIDDYNLSHLSELVRRSQFDFDSQSVRPYLPFHEVRQGVLDTAATLFHLKFRQEPNVPSWDPMVETWDVLEGGKMIGRFYLDMHPRPGKYSHAEMMPVLDGVQGKQLPEAILVCNFPVPTADDPGLMSFDDLDTFFHEFGHLMHHILGGQQEWAGISGVTTEGDFVEAPSQMLEEWMRSPQVLASFAKHYKTGQPIPAELVARMDRALAFGRATWVMRQNSFTALSYDVYKTRPDNVDLDATSLEDEKRYTMFTPLPGTHLYASFGHLGPYSSAYYTYLWDKVIAEDFFRQFDQENLLAGPTPMRYRHTVLEPGGSVSANDLVRNFLGREQNMQAFQKWMGEEFVGAAIEAHGAR